MAILRISCLCLAAIFMAGSANAAESGFQNYDGDTLRATFRVENIDAPELKGACDSERQLAVRAREFTKAWLARGRVTITQTGVDRYKRVLARVTRDGEDLGNALVAAGLARPWRGKRENWC